MKIRYEDLLRNASQELGRIADLLNLQVRRATIDRIAAAHAFTTQTGRQPGQEQKSAHARKGVVGDYRDQFSSEEQRILSNVLGSALTRMGYAT